MIKLIFQGREGLTMGVRRLASPLYPNVRMTIPARERLAEFMAKVNLVVARGLSTEYDYNLYSVKLWKKCPPDLVVVRIIGQDCTAIRLNNEPEFPNEIPTLWEQIDFTPCPKCGAPLIWFEAGYVPGYRICNGKKHHHWIADREDEE